MATAIQRRGGTTAEHANFTGLAREITVDTTKKTIVVHDGTTSGGIPLATEAALTAISGTVGNIVADITGVIAGNGLTGGADSGNANLNVGAGYGISVSSDAVSISNADVRGLFSASGDLAYNTSTGVFSFTNDAGDIEGVTAGNGLIGGGTSGTVTLNIGAGTGILINADDVAVNATYIKSLFSATDAGGDGSFAYSNGEFTYTGPNQAEANARMDAYLVGGGGITKTNGTFAVGAGTGITVNADDVAVNATYVKGLFSATDSGGDGSFSYSDGVFTYTGPSQAEANTRIDARISGGTGVTYTSGVIAIGQAVATTSNVTFNDMTVSGNLTVSGTTTTVNTETINLADSVILLNSNEAGTPSQDAGIEIERGTSANKTLIWNETTDKWTVGAETFVAATFEGALTGNVTGTVSTLSNHDTADLAEGTNLYFTAARARGNISVTDAGGDGSLSYDSGTGVITYTGPSQAEANTRIDARISGGAGLTYTSGVLAVGTGTGITVNADDVAVNATYITSLFSATDAGGDGSFSYSNGVFTYTGPSAAEVRAHFSAGTGVAISSGQISIGQAVGTTSNVSFNNVTATGNFFGNVTGNVTGNAGTATTLATARTSGGVSFNGSAAIDLPGVKTAGNQNTTGNAGTATKWATARTITLTGDVTGVSGNFDGSDNLSFATTIAANSVALGTDTTGNYVASVANGSYITGGAAGSEGATLTLAVDATTTATASKVAARDASGDLYAVIFQGTASSARYADLAERYEADAILEPGTVVCFGGEKEITACDHENDHAVAGVVSTDPAYMMNSAAGNNDTHPYIALTGRVPVKVVGPVAKGDLLVASSVKGHAMANNGAKAGTIIGKAIGSSDNGESVVEALINLM